MDPARAHHRRVTGNVWSADGKYIEGSFEGIATWDGKELLMIHDPAKPFPLRFPRSDRPAPYLVAICDALAKTLEHAAGVPARLLLGYAATFDFWWDEVRHAVEVIDGYQGRFKQFE